MQEAAQLMKSEDVGALPIVEDGRLTGVDHGPRPRDPRRRGGPTAVETTVRELASKDVVTIDPQQSLEEAARLMARAPVRRLPVVEEDGSSSGCSRRRMSPQAGHDTLTGDVVQKISQ